MALQLSITDSVSGTTWPTAYAVVTRVDSALRQYISVYIEIFANHESRLAGQSPVLYRNFVFPWRESIIGSNPNEQGYQLIKEGYEFTSEFADSISV